MQEDSDIFIINEEEEGERLDKILAFRLREIGSRTYFQSLIEQGKVLLNGAIVKKRVCPKAGDEIEIEYLLTPELTLKPENIPLAIIYEDDDMLVANKAAGMVVHPAVGNWSGTFVNALLFHCQNFFETQSLAKDVRPGIVHRLDKETSGLIIAAKSSQAQQKLIEAFAQRNVYKEYLAVCIGNPGNGSVNAPIGRHPINRKMMAVVEGGKPALTHYRTLAFDGELSLVSLVIATGRTHQIRVHMKHRKTPVLGDSLYGIIGKNAKLGAARQLLHAYRLKFTHPISGEPLEFVAEIPLDMSQFMKKFSDLKI